VLASEQTVAIAGTNRFFRAGPPTGAADISGITRLGIRLELELKTRHGRRTPEQKNWVAFIERFGGVYVLVTYDDRLPLAENLGHAVRLVLDAITRRHASLTGPQQ
jgi:hypothetical protein